MVQQGLPGIEPTHISISTTDTARENKADFTYRITQTKNHKTIPRPTRPQTPLMRGVTHWLGHFGGSGNWIGEQLGNVVFDAILVHDII